MFVCWVKCILARDCLVNLLKMSSTKFLISYKEKIEYLVGKCADK